MASRTPPSSAIRRRTAVSAVIAVTLLLCTLGPASIAAAADVPHVLVFSGTYGFRHPSISTGNEAIQQLADESGAFTVEFTELPTDLNADKLRAVDVLLFNSTTGRFPLTADQRHDVEQFWGCGGGFVGVHAAADANYGWAAYAELIGAQFDSHPHGAGAGDVRLVVENSDHPVNAAFADTTEFMHEDEYYRWIRDVRGTQDVIPLLSIDETTVAAGIQTGSTPYVHHQPTSWVKTFRGSSRVYYTNLGHNDATWALPEFRTSLVDGVTWVSQMPLNTYCLDNDWPLPGPPAAPTPDPQAPREPCVAGPGETILTPAGTSETVSVAPVPAYFGKGVRTYLLDLSAHPAPSADVTFRADWDVPTDDYDLIVAAPWGAFSGSDHAQPAFEPAETAFIDNATHCAKLVVAVFNHAGMGLAAPQLTVSVDAEPDAGPASRIPDLPVPGTPAYIVAAPNGAVTGFVPPVVAITKGGSLTLVGGDTMAHNIACDQRDPVTQRPLCQSGYAALGEQAQVAGVENLPNGTHGLHCQLHPQMVAQLIVAGTPSDL